MLCRHAILLAGFGAILKQSQSEAVPTGMENC